MIDERLYIRTQEGHGLYILVIVKFYLPVKHMNRHTSARRETVLCNNTAPLLLSKNYAFSMKAGLGLGREDSK